MLDDQVFEYVQALSPYDHPLLEQMDTEARVRDDIQPMVGLEEARLLGLLIRLIQPKRVLEVGTGIAYSTIWISSALKETGGKLISVDNHPRTIVEARRNIEQADLSKQVTLIHGDAKQELDNLVQEGAVFDMILQDCGKSTYLPLYEIIYQLLSPGGILISDDTLMQFDPQVRKGLGEYVRAYNKVLAGDSRYYSAILSIGQGLTLSVKRRGEDKNGDY